MSKKDNRQGEIVGCRSRLWFNLRLCCGRTMEVLQRFCSRFWNWLRSAPAVSAASQCIENEHMLPHPSSKNIPSLPSLIPSHEVIHLLFVGLDSSGISTTAWNLLGVPAELQTSLKKSEMEIIELTQSLPLIDLHAIDVPGLCKGGTVHQDAELVTALNSYIKATLPNNIPNTVFIISRFDDERFEGESSEFSKMLIALSYTQGHWTDLKYSNVVLVLTYASQVKEDVERKLKMFQETFHKVFPRRGKSVRCVAIDNSQIGSVSSLINSMIEMKGINSPVFMKHLRNVNQVKQDEDEMLFSARKHAISEFLPMHRAEISGLLELLLQGTHFDCFHSRSTFELRNSRFVSFFPSSKCCSNAQCSKRHNTTKLFHTTKILMGDGRTETAVADLRIGNKLFNREMSHGVVTNVVKVLSKDINLCSGIGQYYYSEGGDDFIGLKYVGRNRFREEELEPERLVLASELSSELYEIELNFGLRGEDNFIANSFVTFAQSMTSLESEC